MKEFAGMFVVSIAFILAGILMILKSKKLKKVCTIETTATIVEVEEKLRRTNEAVPRKQYHPVYEYFAEDKSIKKSGGVYSSDKDKYKVGDIVQIKYNPEKNTEFFIEGSSDRTKFGIVLIIGGVIFAIVSFMQLK